jgi:hypothetical protein
VAPNKAENRTEVFNEEASLLGASFSLSCLAAKDGNISPGFALTPRDAKIL